MEYLERNKQILKEIGEQFQKDPDIIKRGQVTGSTSYTIFTSLGSYYSAVLGRELFIGLKENYLGEIRSDCDLAKIAVIAKYFPGLIPRLPVFHGFGINQSGEEIGTITEDFSNGGKYPVQEAADLNPKSWAALLPWDLNPLMPESYLHGFDLAKLCFLIHGSIKLGDFDKILFGLSVREIFAKFPIGLTIKDFGEYTQRNRLHIHYDL